MAANGFKFYVCYLNKLLGQHNNTYHHSMNPEPANVDYSVLTENINTNPKPPEFKVNNRVRILKYEDIFSKGYTENW